MATVMELLGLERADTILVQRLERTERVLGRLLSDQAIGNVLKGPFRLPDTAQPGRAFQ